MIWLCSRFVPVYGETSSTTKLIFSNNFSRFSAVEILLLSSIFTIYLLYKYATYGLSVSNLALTMSQCLQCQQSCSANVLQSIQSSTLFNFSPVGETLNIEQPYLLNDVAMPCKVDEKYWQFSVPLAALSSQIMFHHKNVTNIR